MDLLELSQDGPGSVVLGLSMDIEPRAASVERAEKREIDEIRLGLGRFPAHRRSIEPVGAGGCLQVIIPLHPVEGRAEGATESFRRGDLLLLDLSRPLSADVGRCTCLLLTISRSALIESFGGMPPLPRIRIPRGAVGARILRSTLFSLLRTRGEFRESQSCILVQTVAALLEDAVYEVVERSIDPDLQRVRDLMRLSRSIRAGLADPDFSAQAVALSMDMSRTQLASLLEGRSFSQLIKRHRLGVARRLLRSGAGRQRSILDISRQVGFSTPSEFSTAYGKAFGALPRADRAG